VQARRAAAAALEGEARAEREAEGARAGSDPFFFINLKPLKK